MGPDTTKGHLETLREAIARLEARGFTAALRPLPGSGGLLAVGSQPDAAGGLAPEALVVEETVRFEGESDPQDESLLLALRTPDGSVRGTFVASYGSVADRDTAAVLERLPSPSARERRSS